jgi:hypothetical protein
MKRISRLALAATAVSLLCPIARADHGYHVKPIIRLFDPAGPIPPDMQFFIGALNNAEQIAFFAGSATNTKSEVLLQYSDGKVSKIAEAGKAPPGATWPKGVRFDGPIGMNAAGCIVFSSTVRVGETNTTGTFLWDYPGRQLITVALTGMTVADNVALSAGGNPASAINNLDQIALAARVLNAAKASRPAIVFRDKQGKLTPVALPDSDLPGGARLDQATTATINDAGVVGFLARRVGDTVESAYVWSQGQITPVAVINSDVPGGRKLARATGVWVNNGNDSVLVAGRLDNASTGSDALFRFANGQLAPLVIAGGSTPDGGKVKAIEAVSAPNPAGQHAILMLLEDGARAVYHLGVDGALAPVIKTGTTVEAGAVTHLGRDALSTGLALNGNGQVALGLRINAGIPVLALLTPREE